MQFFIMICGGSKNTCSCYVYYFHVPMFVRSIVYISVSDPYSLNPDPDPAKNLNPDPDPDPDPDLDPGKFFSPAKNLPEIEERKKVVHKTIKKLSHI